MSQDEERFMRSAIISAREGIEAGQSPFGACIVQGDKIIALAHNTVWKDTDITAHAEIVAIRLACKRLETIDLSGSVIYSTCEPCPMCFSACHWARISKIVFGARIEDAQKAGFNELNISNERMKQISDSSVEIIGDFLRDDCVELFQVWLAKKDARAY